MGQSGMNFLNKVREEMKVKMNNDIISKCECVNLGFRVKSNLWIG